MISPFLLREVVNTAYPQHDTTLLIELVAGMIALSVMTSVIGVAQTWISNQVGQRVMHDLRAAVYAHLQRMSLAFFTRTRTGEVQSRIANDIGGDRQRRHVDRHLDRPERHDGGRDGRRDVPARLAPGGLLADPAAVLRVADAARGRGAPAHPVGAPEPPGGHVDARRGVAVGVGHPARQDDGPLAGARAALQRRVRRTRRPRGARAHGRPLADGHRADELRDHAGARVLVRRHELAGGHAISIGTVVAFTTLQTRLLFPIQSLLSVGLEVQTSLALFGRIFEYLDLPVDIVERPGARPLARRPRRRAPAGRVVPLRAGRALDARGHHAEIPAGTRTALVGETGSGKTTLAYLVARLYEPERGCVSIDGVDIRDVTLGSLAATVGLVSQETYLFHASIRENLRFACPEASDEEIEDAARAAQIHELIASLPDGYDTPVGERGYRFSGGEKQRIAIARTVLRNPPVLILDEATSALDTETERAVQQALDELSRGRTTIAIAHRLSTIRDADQILVLDGGRDRRARHPRGAGVAPAAATRRC